MFRMVNSCGTEGRVDFCLSLTEKRGGDENTESGDGMLTPDRRLIRRNAWPIENRRDKQLDANSPSVH